MRESTSWRFISRIDRRIDTVVRLVLAAATVLVVLVGCTRLALAAEPAAHTINAVAEDPADVAVLYAATDAGLFKTTNDGTSWQLITIPGAAGQVSAVAVSPTDSQHVLAGSGLGLFDSKDGGATWTKVRNPKSGVIVISFASSVDTQNRPMMDT